MGNVPNERGKVTSAEATMAVVCGVIERAFQNIEEDPPKIDALAWLVSRESSFWFSMAGIDQRAALRARKWPERAEVALFGPESRWGRAPTADQDRLIRDALRELARPFTKDPS